jgi:hypothetical protein
MSESDFLHPVTLDLVRTASSISESLSSSSYFTDLTNLDDVPSISALTDTDSVMTIPWKRYIPVLKILVIFSCPSNTNPLRLQTEEKAIREALFHHSTRQTHESGGMASDNIYIKFLPACTVDDLRSHLLQDEYHLLHFSGHADRTTLLSNYMLDQLATTAGIIRTELTKDSKVQSYVGQAAEMVICQYEQQIGSIDYADISIPVAIQVDYHKKSTNDHVILEYKHAFIHDELVKLGIGSLAFESSTGQASFVPPSALATLLSHHKSLQCVVMNACSSFIQGHYILPHVPLIISHQGQIADHESIAFSQGFYSSLRLGSISFETCYKHGVCNVDLKRMSVGMPKRPSLVSYEELIILQSNDALCKDRCNNQKDSVIDENIVNKSTSEGVENSKLRTLVNYGLQLLHNKDQELETARSMIRLLMTDCSNPDTARLARSLFPDHPSPKLHPIDMHNALLLMSSSLSMNHSLPKTVLPLSHQRVDPSSDKSSKGKSSTSTGRSKHADNSSTRRSQTNRGKGKGVNINYAKTRASAATIACLKKPAEHANVKIAFGYREPDRDSAEKRPSSTPKRSSDTLVKPLTGKPSSSSPSTSASLIPQSPRKTTGKSSSKEEKSISIDVPEYSRPKSSAIHIDEHQENRPNTSPTSVTDVMSKLDSNDAHYAAEVLNLSSDLDDTRKEKGGKLMTVYNQTNAASVAFRKFLKEKRSTALNSPSQEGSQIEA